MTRRERLEARIEKRRQWAEKRRQEAQQRYATANELSEQFYMGQPILVGHHSERAARAGQRKIHNAMRAGIHAETIAKHHDSKAAGIERMLNGRTVFSDDEDAPERLRERIVKLKTKRDNMKASNAAYRKGPAAWAAHLGVSAEREAELRSQVEAGYSWCQQPHPSYELTNLGSNIRRLEKRLAEIEARAERMERAETAGVLIEGDEYVRVTFPEKPGRDILDALRGAGFRWSGGSWHGRRDALPTCVSDQTEGEQ